MATERGLETMLRARVHPEQKQKLEAIALEKQLRLSDVIRLAIREYLATRCQDRPEQDPGPSPPPPPPPKPPPPRNHEAQPELVGV